MPCKTEIDRRGFLRSVAMTGAAVAMKRQGAAAESAAPPFTVFVTADSRQSAPGVHSKQGLSPLPFRGCA